MHQIDNQGRKTRPWEEYFQDGKLSGVGAYVAAEETGEWKYYDPRGTLVRTKNR